MDFALPTYKLLIMAGTAGFVALMVAAVSAQSNYACSENKDFFGGDLVDYANFDQNNCASKCNEQVACTAYTFVKKWQGQSRQVLLETRLELHTN